MNSNPFYEVGGDFLDFFTLTDGVIGIYLGDVTGKGLPAALYAALAVGTLRGVHAVLSTVNRRVMLRGVSSPRYVAVQHACFDPRTGVLRIASAGMTEPSHSFSTGSWNFAAFLQDCLRRRNTKAKPYKWNATIR